MTITVKYFGLLVDITRKREEVFHFQNGNISINSLQTELVRQYPKINNKSYSFAVNQMILKENMELKDNDEIALLPPFAGG